MTEQEKVDAPMVEAPVNDAEIVPDHDETGVTADGGSPDGASAVKPAPTGDRGFKADEYAQNLPKMHWYVVQAFSGYEQRVAAALQERIKFQHMEEDFGEVLVPKEKIKEIKDGRKRESERKFFPGYVLVRMRMTNEAWQLVKHTERVLGFIGGRPERPLPITDAEAQRILDRLKETADSPRPKTMFEVGEVVRAVDGAFKDFVGTVEQVDYEKNRLTVSIAIFGRATPVELEFSQVEKDV